MEEVDAINSLRFQSRAAKLFEDPNASIEALNQVRISSQHLATKGARKDEDVLRDLHRRAQQKINHVERERSAEKGSEGAKSPQGQDDEDELGDSGLKKESMKASHGRSMDRKAKERGNKEVANDADEDVNATTAAGITSLLQQSADISAHEVEQEKQKHTEMLLHIGDLVSDLKDSTMLMNKLVVEQNVHLEQIQQAAGENVEELEQQKQNMAKETKKMTMSFWTTIYTAIWLIGMFIATYLVIKIFPKPVSVQAFHPPRCRALSESARRLQLPLLSLRSASTPHMGSAIEEFEAQWAKAGVETLAGVKHGSFPDALLGDIRGLGLDTKAARAEAEVKTGTELVSLPLKQCLYTQGNKGSGAAEAPAGRLRDCVDRELWQRVKGTTRLSLMLLDAYMDRGQSTSATGSGKQGWVGSYIDILPGGGDLGTPVHWLDSSTTGAAFSALEAAYPALATRVRDQQQSYRTLYKLLLTPSVSTGRPFLPDEQAVPFSRLVWAMESVTSRAFQGVGGLESTSKKFELGAIGSAACVSLAFVVAAIPSVQIPGGFLDRESLVVGLATIGALTLLPAVFDSAGAGSDGSSVILPVIDSCNHRSSDTANCEMAYETSRESFVLRSKGGGDLSSTSSSSSSSSPGVREMTISYGNRDNDDFLQFFGFVEADNPHDCYRMALPDGPKDDNVLVVTRGPRAEWTVPISLSDSDDSRLRAALRAELDRITQARKALSPSVGEGQGQGGAGSEKASALLSAFLGEKAKVLEAALVRI